MIGNDRTAFVMDMPHRIPLNDRFTVYFPQLPDCLSIDRSSAMRCCEELPPQVLFLPESM